MNVKSFILNYIPLVTQLLNIVLGLVSVVSSLVAAISSDFEPKLGKFSNFVKLDGQLKSFVKLEWAVFSIGIIIVVTATLRGTLEICKRNFALKKILIVMGILIIGEMVLGILVIVEKHNIQDNLESQIAEAFVEASKTTDIRFLALLNEMQSQFRCCGMHGFTFNQNIPCLPSFDILPGCADAIWAELTDQLSETGSISMFIAIGLDILFLIVTQCGGKKPHKPDEEIEMIPILDD